MGGGKGGSQSTTVEIPAWAESKMKENLNKASAMGEIGYMPYYGPEVAAFTPMQEAGMQGAYDAASAYGLAAPGGDAMAGVPQAQEFAGGIMGYGSGDLFEQARAEFAARNPAQAEAYNQFFEPYGTEETNPNYNSQQNGRPPGYPDYLPWPPTIDMGRFA